MRDPALRFGGGARGSRDDKGLVQDARPGDGRSPEPGRRAGAVQQARRRIAERHERRDRKSATGDPPLPELRKAHGRLAPRRAHRAKRGRQAIHRRPEPAGGWQLLQLPPALEAGIVLWYHRTEPLPVRQAARLKRSDPEVRLRQNLQRRGIRCLLQHAALRPQRSADRGADHPSRGAAARPGVPRQQVTLSRREFLQALAAAAAAGLPLAARPQDETFYDLPPFGNVSLLHFTDCHAQLLPLSFREPSVNLGVGGSRNLPPHLVGEALLKHFGFRPGSREAHAFTHLDFARAAERYGKMGGFAHLAALVKKLRAERGASLLLDGGDTWQGSATSLWTRGQDMIEAQKLLGIDMTTGHWEFTYGAARVREVVDRDFAGRIEFLAQNVETRDFGDPVFKAYTIRSLGGIPVAVIGQAFPYTPIAHPRRFVPDWKFGIEERRLQSTVDEARGKGAQVVALLSHNGMDVDLKLARRVAGIDVILGGHTHDGVPAPVGVSHTSGKTLVTNAGSNGKFLAVLDLDVRGGRIAGHRYRLLPVFANLLPADPEMARLIATQRAPYTGKLSEKLAVTETLLYRRDRKSVV